MRLIIFSDLDGTLLNHDDYSLDAARPVLDRISQARIPLILTTSKTRHEVEQIRDIMAICDPFIVENGGGIYFPLGYRGFKIGRGEEKKGYTLVQLGLPYEQIRCFFISVQHRFGAKGFGDLPLHSIMELTGLPPDRAALANIREFTEPFLMDRDEDISALTQLAGEKGMKITCGGRFHHLMGIDQDKGKAVRTVCEIFYQNLGRDFITVGIGDSENDLPMLQQVDIPVLVPRPVKGYLDIQLPRLIRAVNPGCRGWNEVVGGLLDEL